MLCKLWFKKEQHGRAVGEDDFVLVHGQPPVERNENRTEPGRREEQREHIRVVVAEEGDAIPVADPGAGQLPRGPLRAPPEFRVRNVLAVEMEGRASGRVVRPALNDARKVQSSFSPDSYSASRPMRSRHSSAVHGSISAPHRESR